VPPAQAQYRGDHTPGFAGLSSGTEPDPGLYASFVVWAYPYSTVVNNSGRDIRIAGRLTSIMATVGFTVITNYSLFGGKLGANASAPFIKNRVESNGVDNTSDFAFTDSSVGAMIGWTSSRADVSAGYNFYIPTGSYSPTVATGNAGLGMYGHEVIVGTTVYLDHKKTWNAAVTFGTEFHTAKHDTDIHVGDLGTLEGGIGKTLSHGGTGPHVTVMNVGLVGYAQFKMTGDTGTDIPAAIRGLRDRVFALGPEFNVFEPRSRLTFVIRYEGELGARNRTQGQMLLLSVGWTVKSLVKAS
jgi:hypothetical protein